MIFGTQDGHVVRSRLFLGYTRWLMLSLPAATCGKDPHPRQANESWHEAVLPRAASEPCIHPVRLILLIG